MKPLVSILFALVASATFAANVSTLPRVYSLSPRSLVAARERLAGGDASLAPALDHLRAQAAEVLKKRPASVMDKSRVPPSGDKHDYLSLAPYFWPNPKTADGLPYVRRDGELNPESKRGTDSVAFWDLGDDVLTLGLAYYFTRDEHYAEHAAKLVRTWFLDEATRMNPHLNYAQGIPGVNHGRGIGILESRHLTEINDGVALLAGSPAWTEKDHRSLQQWMAAYFEWVTTSKNGRDEHAAKNNHGSWYAAQTAHLAVSIGRLEDAREIVRSALANRIPAQFEPNGRQPHEDARTKSFDYYCFNLEAWMQLAVTGENIGVDVWGFETSDGRGLRKAVQFFAPFVDPEKPWIKKDLHLDPRSRILPIIAQALYHEPNSELVQLLKRHADSQQAGARWHLLFAQP